MKVLGFVAVVCLGIVVLISVVLGVVLAVIAHADDDVPGCSP
jgi:hypothetical protein